MAIDGNWNENYGSGGITNGKNASLSVDKEQEIIFFYNDATHKFTDSTKYSYLPEGKRPYIVITGSGLKQKIYLYDENFNYTYFAQATLTSGNYFIEPFIGCDNRKKMQNKIEIKKKQSVNIYFDKKFCDLILVDKDFIKNSNLHHDTFDENYRKPFNALKKNENLSLCISSNEKFIKNANLILKKGIVKRGNIEYQSQEVVYPLKKNSLKKVKNKILEYWCTTLKIDKIGVYGYKFNINNLIEYGDDSLVSGSGKATNKTNDLFQLTVYDPTFTIPKWFEESIVYQIFPDRFRNGDPQNDNIKTTLLENKPNLNKKWNDIPSSKPEEISYDFFGGDLKGVTQKLDYLKSLGVTTLYLNPFHEGATNHKYDAANYMNIDPRFGTIEDFLELAEELKKRNMYLLMDGTFNHTGDDSIYFDRYNKHEWVGAYEYWSRVYDKMREKKISLKKAKELVEIELTGECQKFSPYGWHNWFDIRNKLIEAESGVNKYDYDSWSGHDNLPVFNVDVNKENNDLNLPFFLNYILYDDNSVSNTWLKRGSNGWRMDVADEIKPEFWKLFRKHIKAKKDINGNSPVILGESWHDSSSYLLGDQFDSVMNYPLRGALLDFILNGDAKLFEHKLKILEQNYPPPAFKSLMNFISSHDTSRALYILGNGQDEKHIAKKNKNFKYEIGKKRLKLATIFQMGYPGVPSIYYADEAGQYGAKDPDNRRTYPWGKEDKDLLNFYKSVGNIRSKNIKLFTSGSLKTLYSNNDIYIYLREYKDQLAIIALNRGEKGENISLKNLDKRHFKNFKLQDLLDPSYKVEINKTPINIPAVSGRILFFNK